MTNALVGALTWIADALAFYFDNVVLEAFSFDDDGPALPFADLPGFDSSVHLPVARRCCTIGWQSVTNLGFGVIGHAVLDPTIGTDPLQLDDLGDHHYGGPFPASHSILSPDKVGHAYTRHGGIIDLGHLRDHADLTRYAASQLPVLLHSGGPLELELDGVEITAHIGVRPGSTPEFCARLGARISYDCAIWHEVLTACARDDAGYQPYSAFSPEDNYSNLLGTLLGYRALMQPKDFNAAMTEQIHMHLAGLGIMGRATATDAVDYVKGHWFDHIGQDLVLLRRHVEPYGTIEPWLVTEADIAGETKQEQLEALRDILGAAPQKEPIDPPEHPEFDDVYQFEVSFDRSDMQSDFHPHLPAGNAPLRASDIATLVDVLRTRYAPDGGTVPG